MMRNRNLLSYLTFAVCVGFTMSMSAGCQVYDRYQAIHHQQPTFADMLNTGRAIEAARQKHGSMEPAEIQAIVRNIRAGRDAWGREYLIAVRQEPTFEYLVVSLGSDGKLDVENINQYFTLKEQNILGDHPRDIVFRNGKPVTLAMIK